MTKIEQKVISKCCKAEIDYMGGGYDGEYIVPISEVCKKCKQTCKSQYSRRGRPSKILF